MLDQVSHLIVDYLCVDEIFSMWVALGCPELEKDVKVALITTFGLSTKRNYTTRDLTMKMSSIRRCKCCGKKSSSRALTNTLKYVCICQQCSQLRLITRKEIKEAPMSSLKEKSRVPWKYHSYTVARKNRTGAYMYWRHDICM